MFDENQLKNWLCKLNFSTQAKDYINLVRMSEPSRRVQSRVGNVTGKYPSRKMGLTIQFESHRNELAFITKTEYNPEVIEYWDQPPSINLRYQTKGNKNLAVIHTPDFFLLKADGAGWVECKTQKELEILTQKNPNRYYFDKNKWRCPPGEAEAEKYGFFYEVWSSDEINSIYLRNICFLEDYLGADTLAVTTEQCELVLALVSANSGITLSELIEISKNQSISVDVIYQLIAHQILFIDLESDLLTEPERALVFSSLNSYQQFKSAYIPIPFMSSSINWRSGDLLIWDGKLIEVINQGETQTWLKDENNNIISIDNDNLANLFEKKQIQPSKAPDTGETANFSDISEIIRKASPSSLSTANRRNGLLNLYWQTKKLPKEVPERTIIRWQQSFRHAEIIHGAGYVGLLPSVQNRGNRLPKLPPRTRELTLEYIGKYFENFKQAKRYSVWVQLKLACEKEDLHYPSHKTFCRMVNERPKFEQETKRKGKIAAYEFEEFYFELDQHVPKHGERPLHIVHIDHTELDVELRCSKTGKNLGRPWLTLVIDAFTRRILAIYLSFDPPSYRSCMMAIRKLIQRYHRFPHTIVVDGGLDFSSVYFETLLARYKCLIKFRPGKKPRTGTVCERIFGTTNTQFIYNLQGNTQISKKNVRFITKHNNPRNLAVWTLETLYLKLCEYCYEVYDKSEHSTLGVSPRELFIYAQQRFGERGHQFIAYDEHFKLMTCPTTNKGTALVYPGRGILINNIYYKSQYFYNPKVENKRVPIRFDPFDAGISYAYVQGCWRECLSEYYAIFKGLSEKLMQIASAEIKRLKKSRRKRFTVNAQLLASFLSDVTETENELIQLQKLRDLAARQIFTNDERAYQAVNGYHVGESAVGSEKPDALNETKNKISDSDNGANEAAPVDLKTLRILGRY